MNNSNDKASAFAAIDLLLNLLMLFIVISAIAIAKMSRPAAGNATEMKAEMVIEMSWPEGNFDDLDLWVLLPSGRTVGFTNKDEGVATLDRDDRGAYGDTYRSEKTGSMQLIRVNKEVAAIRAKVPGRYVVNVHYYNDFTTTEIGVDETDPVPNPAIVKLTKLNPQIVELVVAKLEMKKVGSEVTAFCFDLDGSGNVTKVDKGCSLPFVQMAPQYEVPGG